MSLEMEDHSTGWVIVPQKSQAPKTVAQRRAITFRDISQVVLRGRSMVDPVAGKVLVGKKSQKKQLKQGQAPWDSPTHCCCKRRVNTHLIEASDTFIRGRSRSSRSRELSSFSLRSFKSFIDCFLFFTSPPARISYAEGIWL